MELLRELREMVQAYLRGDGHLDTLVRWLGMNVQAVADARQEDLSDLSDAIWYLVAEYDADLMDEPSLREALSIQIQPDPELLASPIVFRKHTLGGFSRAKQTLPWEQVQNDKLAAVTTMATVAPSRGVL